MMNSPVRDLTTGNLWSGIFRFSVPLIFTNLLQNLFNVADVAVVGRFAGPLPMGAVGCTSTLVFLFTGVLMGLGSAVNAVTAKAFGGHHPEKIKKTVHTAFSVCLAAGILLLVFGETILRSVLLLLRTKEDLLDQALLYMQIYLLGMPALGIYNFGNAVFSAAGDTRTPLFFLLISGILNVLLNLFFVIRLGMAAEGVAAASAISQYAAAACVITALLRTEGSRRLIPSALRPDGEVLLSILSVGIPAALQNVIFSIANLSLQFGVNSFPTVMVAGDAAARNADGLVYNVMAAFYVACSSFMGQNFGAGNRNRVQRSFRISLVYSFGSGALFGMGLLLCGPAFLSLFTASPEVINCGMQRLRVMGPSYAFSSLMDGTIAASRALGKGMVPTVIVILGSCVLRLFWVAAVFPLFRTIPSLYIVFFCTWIITASAEFLYFRKIFDEVLPPDSSPACGTCAPRAGCHH